MSARDAYSRPTGSLFDASSRFIAPPLLGLVCAAGLGAQTVVGTVVEATDEHPVGGAFVLLVDEAGVERARTLTTSRGTFRLNAERPGAYRLRLERIGLADTETDTFALSAGETVNHRITASSVPIQLAAIRVEADAGSSIEPRCGAPTGEIEDLSRVWREIEKALEATAWTVENSRYRYEVLLHRQARGPDGTPIAEPEYLRRRSLRLGITAHDDLSPCIRRSKQMTRRRPFPTRRGRRPKADDSIRSCCVTEYLL